MEVGNRTSMFVWARDGVLRAMTAEIKASSHVPIDFDHAMAASLLFSGATVRRIGDTNPSATT
jgi:hypothetical protein